MKNIFNSLFRKNEWTVSQFLKYLGIGFVMGASDIVPGVSGGTMAFIFGVYERLIDSIKTVSGTTLKLFLKGKISEAFESVPFSFLLPLGSGLLLAVVSLSSVLTYMLETYPVLLWAFFFGLVVASIRIVSKRIEKWTPKEVVAAGVSAVAAFVIVGAVPTETAATPFAFLISGAIAICAMILPGVSGSFLLIILGKYEQVLTAVHDKDILTLAIFMLGAVVGLALFSRLLSWLFDHHESLIISILTGFMLGSLRKIWPWKETVTSIIDSHGEVVPVVQKNVMPSGFNSEFLLATGLFIVAVVIVLLIENNSKKKPEKL